MNFTVSELPNQSLTSYSNTAGTITINSSPYYFIDQKPESQRGQENCSSSHSKVTHSLTNSRIHINQNRASRDPVKLIHIAHP